MRTRTLLANFTNGEIDPQFEGRADITKYYNSASIVENMILKPLGGFFNRPGLRFVKEVKYSAKKTYLLPFRFGASDNYILEVGDLYFRVYRDNGPVLGGGDVHVEIVTPYLEADIPQLQISQSADVIFFTHPNYKPRRLTRTSHIDWDLSIYRMEPYPTAEHAHVTVDSTLTPEAISGDEVVFTLNLGAATDDDWLVTSTNMKVGAYTVLNGGVFPSSLSRQIVVTRTVVGGVDTPGIITVEGLDIEGDFLREVIIPGATGVQVTGSRLFKSVTSIVGSGWVINTTNDTIKIGYIQDTFRFLTGDVGRRILFNQSEASISTFVSATSVKADIIYDFESTTPMSAGTWRVQGGYKAILLVQGNYKEGQTVSVVSLNANVFRKTDIGNILYILKGCLKIIKFISANSIKCKVLKNLDNAQATQTQLWQMESDAWKNSYGWPRTIAFFDQRLCFAGNIKFPNMVWMSRVAEFNVMKKGSDPSDSIFIAPYSGLVDTAQWLIPTNVLFMGTAGAEMRIGSGRNDDPVAPDNITAKSESIHGSDFVQGIRIDQKAIFVQRGGLKLYELGFSYEANGYVATDLNLFSSHITGTGISKIAFAELPNHTIWAIRKDGVLAGCTYLKLQDEAGWHRQVTQGLFESMAVVPYGTYDRTWFIVNRTIDGVVKRYVEYMEAPHFPDLNSAFYVDSGLSYSGAPVTNVTGLGHLNGMDVDVVADGVFYQRHVTAGTLTVAIPVAASNIHVGLHYTSKFKSVRLANPQDVSKLQAVSKRIFKATVRFFESKGCKMGDSVSNLYNVPSVASGTLFSGDEEVSFDGNHDEDGYVHIIQDTPFPLTVLCMILHYESNND